uniref:Uncharacterized protein n=1 Tax=Magnetococcus massalia (strain MO-1) TaxID=451514 RepID=A0A1S7LKT2_MAGMO|nr:protein of unknown function [Candidatus Magnetococcus massalia]
MKLLGLIGIELSSYDSLHDTYTVSIPFYPTFNNAAQKAAQHGSMGYVYPSISISKAVHTKAPCLYRRWIALVALPSS